MYPKIILHKQREQSWLFGHPWIFSKAIKENLDIVAGSLITLYSHEGIFLGIGYYNKNQTIAIRMLTKNEEAIDTTWFYNKLNNLKNYRQKFLKDTNAYRLCYGESDKIPGLVVDVYGLTAVIQINTKGIEKLLPLIIESLNLLGFSSYIVDCNSISAKKEKVSVKQDVQSGLQIKAIENGIHILIPIIKAQKTGWFCDQRDNRLLVKELVEKQNIKTVLNLFSYTGGFSLYALKGGAKKVVNVDQDEGALDLFKQMVLLNNLPSSCENIHLDIWQYFQKYHETFDLVIVDPPAFVKDESKKAQGLKGYLNIFKNAIPKVKKGGFMMVYSCSHYIKEEDMQWILRQAYEQTSREFQTVKTLSQSFDHPVPAWFEQSSYLKGYLLLDML
jgi:23S rRNA (cytosine1962-C5)-methyltransferase